MLQTLVVGTIGGIMTVGHQGSDGSMLSDDRMAMEILSYPMGPKIVGYNLGQEYHGQ